MAVTRLGKCTWGAAEIRAVLKGVLNPAKAPAARADLSRGFAALGYPPLEFVSQGSVGLTLAFQEMKARRPTRSVVVVPAYCCPSVPNAVRAAGLTLRAAPVRADLNMDLDALGPLLGDDVLAVVGVHMYGLPLDLDRLQTIGQRAGAYVVDDAAHVVGLAPPHLGTKGDVGLLSFHHSKTLTGGSPQGGGALVLSNADLAPGIARRIAELPEGQSRLGYYIWFALRYALEITPRGLTEYSDTFTAAVRSAFGIGKHEPERMSAAAAYAVTAQMTRLARLLDRRRAIVGTYLDLMKQTPQLALAQTVEPQSLTRVMVRWQGDADAEDVRIRLMRNWITTRMPYPMWMDASDPTAAAMRKIATTHLELPASPALRDEQLKAVVGALVAMVTR